MFKYKPDKLKNQEKVCTLDETHRNCIKAFEKSRTTIDAKKQRLEQLNDKLNKLNEVNQFTLTLDDIKQKSQLKTEIAKAKREIDDITNYTAELDYYSKTDTILLRYYDVLENNGNDASPNSNTVNVVETMPQMKSNRKRSRAQQSSQQGILCFFENYSDNKKSKPSKPEERSNIKPSTASDSVFDNSQNVLPKNRAILHEQYMHAINNGTKNIRRLTNISNYCENCKMERTLVQSEGVYVCNGCGETECALIESDVPNYKDCSLEKFAYPYKRLNHLVE